MRFYQNHSPCFKSTAHAAGTSTLHAFASSFILSAILTGTPFSAHSLINGSVSRGSASEATKAAFAKPCETFFDDCFNPTTLSAVFSRSTCISPLFYLANRSILYYFSPFVKGIVHFTEFCSQNIITIFQCFAQHFLCILDNPITYFGHRQNFRYFRLQPVVLPNPLRCAAKIHHLSAYASFLHY